jgi:hypothetical protein
LFPPNPKELNMQYKTIVLNLLRQRRELHNQLKTSRTLLPTLDRYAEELRTSHEAWQANLSEERPGTEEIQIAAEALEIALKEVTDRLPSESPTEDEPLSLEAAMAFIRRPSSPA